MTDLQKEQICMGPILKKVKAHQRIQKKFDLHLNKKISIKHKKKSEITKQKVHKTVNSLKKRNKKSAQKVTQKGIKYNKKVNLLKKK